MGDCVSNHVTKRRTSYVDDATSGWRANNLCGTSICAGVSSNLLSPYQELYKKDKEELLAEIAICCGYILISKPIRTLTAMQFLMDLILQDRLGKLYITSAWYDGSYSYCLGTDAKSFPYYELKNEMRDSSPHMPWWTIFCNSETIAMFNIETDELVTLTGKRYDLKTEKEEVALVMELLIQNEEFNITIENTLKLLQDHNEWIKRYTGYAKEISVNIDFIKSVREKFHEWSPLKLYLNATNAKNASKNVKFELRYLGQTVADLIYKNELKLDTAKYNVFNKQHFDCDICLPKVNWDGYEAKEFRSFFKNRKHVRNTEIKRGNAEHRIESLFLSEFSKSKDKALPFIKPVKIANIRFPMPTPLSASNHKQTKYSGFYGGGIDILARTRTSGSTTNLCIMELKDENTKKEPPKDVIKQALTYATFIRELLRSSSGKDWWNLFGFHGNIPKKLVLFAACVMPTNENNDKSFEGMELDIKGDTIKLHYLYFTEEQNKITIIETSLNPKTLSKLSKIIKITGEDNEHHHLSRNT